MLRQLLKYINKNRHIAPDEPIVAIGDIHGRDQLFDQISEMISTRPGWKDARVILLGDLIDRGPGSGAVVDAAMARGHLALRGNHEKMMLDFLAGKSRDWLDFGGAETLESFGLPLTVSPSTAREKLGEARLEWLRAMPLSFRSGNLFFCHAGGAPAAPLDAQPEGALVWGHPDGPGQRDDGTIVVHGHYPGRKARWRGGRLNLDSGAAYGGPLSAALISPGSVEIIEARPT